MFKPSWPDVALAIAALVVVVGFAWFCVHMASEAEAREYEREHGACRDEAHLLATTAGSPSKYECPNDRHRMRVEVATHPSNEEAAALVFCQCAEVSK